MAGLEVGDRIVEINGRRFTDRHEFFVLAADAGLLSGQPVRMGVVTRAGEEREIVVTASVITTVPMIILFFIEQIIRSVVAPALLGA